MKDFSIEYDDKTHAFSIEHTNLLKAQAKEFDKCLIVKPFQVGVQVALEKDVTVSSPKEVAKPVKQVANGLAEKVWDAVNTLYAELQRLKKAEDGGDK